MFSEPYSHGEAGKSPGDRPRHQSKQKQRDVFIESTVSPNAATGFHKDLAVAS